MSPEISFNAARDDLVRQFRQDLVWRAVELFFYFERKSAIGEVWIALADENQIAFQDPAATVFRWFPRWCGIDS